MQSQKSVEKPLPDKVQIELKSSVLAKLIASGILHGNECRCLNSNAKRVVWQTLLNSSLVTEASI